MNRFVFGTLYCTFGLTANNHFINPIYIYIFFVQI